MQKRSSAARKASEGCVSSNLLVHGCDGTALERRNWPVPPVLRSKNIFMSIPEMQLTETLKLSERLAGCLPERDLHFKGHLKFRNQFIDFTWKSFSPRCLSGFREPPKTNWNIVSSTFWSGIFGFGSVSRPN